MTQGQLYRDKWLCDETIYRNLNILYIALKEHGTKWTRTAVNRALGELIEEECFSVTSTSKYYKKWFLIQCPYDEGDGDQKKKKVRKVYYYYQRVKGEVPPEPVAPSDVEDILAKSH